MRDGRRNVNGERPIRRVDELQSRSGAEIHFLLHKTRRLAERSNVNGENKPTLVIPGMEKGLRVDSRVLEERIQRAVADGHRSLEIIAQGQHGIGGRLWRAGNETVQIRVMGTSDQHEASYAPAALDGWAEHARTLAAGQGLDALGPPIAEAAPHTPRDVFLFVISGAKERNPAAAMALISRV